MATPGPGEFSAAEIEAELQRQRIIHLANRRLKRKEKKAAETQKKDDDANGEVQGTISTDATGGQAADERSFLSRLKDLTAEHEKQKLEDQGQDQEDQGTVRRDIDEDGHSVLSFNSFGDDARRHGPAPDTSPDVSESEPASEYSSDEEVQLPDIPLPPPPGTMNVPPPMPMGMPPFPGGPNGPAPLWRKELESDGAPKEVPSRKSSHDQKNSKHRSMTNGDMKDMVSAEE